MLFLVAFVVVFSYVQSECAYTIKAGDSIYALSGALGCGNGENSNYGKLLELNKLLAGQPNAIGDFSDGKYSPGEILFVPDACYTTTLPANCKPVNDCSNGNGNDVCPSALATCTETDLAFRCACKANAIQSSTTVCSSRSSKFCTPTCVAKPTSAPGSTTKAAETTTAGAVIPGSTTGTSTKSPGSATSTDECGSLVASCDTCLSNSKCKWCASDRSCVAAELPYCGSERRSIEMCGAGCYPDSDKCCTSEGKVSKAGESCAVSANECVLPTGTCDGERPDCVAQFVADQSPCNNGNGACVSGVCKNANQCSVPALKSLSGCQTTCTADGEDVLEMCLCEGGATSPSTTCWSKDRLEKFSRGEGDDVAQYKATCPSFCSCKCTGATQSDASDNALSTLLSFVVVVAIVLFQ